MKKIILLALLLISYVTIYASELSDENAVILIKNKLNKTPRDIYSVSMSDSLKDISFNNISIIKRGKLNKDKNYWPVRARIKGQALVILYGNSNPLWAKKDVDNFDKIIEARLKINDFDEWEVEITKVESTPVYIKIPRLYKISKIPTIEPSVFNFKYEVLKHTDLKNNEKIKKNSLPNYNATKSLFAASNNEGIIHLYIKDLVSGKFEKSEFGTFVEKCTWSQNNINIFCAVPPYYQGSLDRNIMNKWLKNRLSFEDDLLMIDSNNLDSAEIIFSAGSGYNFDGVKLALGYDRYIYWLDKRTNTSWAFDLEKGNSNTYVNEDLIADGIAIPLKKEENSEYFLEKKLRTNKKIVLAIIKQGWDILEQADSSLQKDREVALAAVKQNTREMNFVDSSLTKDKKFMLTLAKEIEMSMVQWADNILLNDKEFILKMLRVKDESPMALHILTIAENNKFIKDKEVFLIAVKHHSMALEFADISLKKDKEVVLAAVKHHGEALKYADTSLKKDKEVVLAAVKQNIKALEFSDISLKKDDEILAVIKNK